MARVTKKRAVRPPQRPSHAKRTPRGGPARRVLLLVATRKGAWLYRGDPTRRTWRVDGPHFLGHIVNHLVLDPRDGRTLLAAAKTVHLGPTVFRSTDFGRTWTEARRPPAFTKAPEGRTGRAVDHAFRLTPGHASEPMRVIYAANLALAFFIQRPCLRRLVGIKAAADDATWKARARRQRYLSYAMAGLVGTIGFLMSAKPAIW